MYHDKEEFVMQGTAATTENNNTDDVLILRRMEQHFIMGCKTWHWWTLPIKDMEMKQTKHSNIGGTYCKQYIPSENNKLQTQEISMPN